MTVVTRRKRAFLGAVDTIAKDIENQTFADMYRTAVRNKVERGDDALFEFIRQLERMPVGIETFIDSPEFLGATDLTLWPEVRKAIVEANQYWWRGDIAFNAALLMGATGTGKTSIGQVTTMYHVYLLSCLRNPQAVYSFPKATSIVFALMGAKPRVVNKVLYVPMRKMIESMPYFQRYMMPAKLIESEMYFEEKNIRIAQSGGDEDAILGEAIIGGVVDEINFMNVVLRSKKAEVTSGRAGLYDQAEQVHSTMQRRKRGRFTRPGPVIGLVIASSSTRYKGDFTDKQKAFLEKNGIKTTYIYNRRQFDVVPKERFSGRTFRLLIGNDIHHDTRVLRDDEETPVGAWVENVPIEYIDDFRKRPYDALRDVMGIANNALSPFIKSRHKIYECVEYGKELNLGSILVRDHVILGEHGMPQVKAGTYCQNPSRPRYVHIDLSRNADRCGIAMVRYEGMTTVARDSGMPELMPMATVEMACTITPDANNEIDIAEVRAFVMHLKTKYGYPIKGVSYDGFDCIEENTLVWTDKGYRAAKDVAVGDMVQSRIGPRPVLQKFMYNNVPTFLLETDHGYSIEATGRHMLEALERWEFRDGARHPVWAWLRLDELTEGQVIRIWDSATEVDVVEYVPLTTPRYGNAWKEAIDCPTQLTEDVAEFLGLMWGDGSIGKDRISMTFYRGEEHDACELIDKVFSPSNAMTIRYVRDANYCQMELWNAELVAWLDANDFRKPAIPAQILASKKSVQAAFLRGLFSTDGSVKSRDGQVSLSTVNLRTAQYVQTTLSVLFGLKTNVTRIDYAVCPPSKKTSEPYHYIVQVQGSRQDYYDRIGFTYERKRDQLEEHLAVQGRKIFTKVKRLTETTGNVVDFEVAEDHAYVVNGFVSHNSRESLQQWRKGGMRSTMISVDRSATPYKQFRDAMYDRRIAIPDDDTLLSEILDLEYDENKDKVDHPVQGSKDCADAVCAAYTNMLERRSTWTAAAQDDFTQELANRASFDERFDEQRRV